jgi:dipeptidyl aminopeptidase/acylaminoacyl peptidase
MLYRSNSDSPQPNNLLLQISLILMVSVNLVLIVGIGIIVWQLFGNRETANAINTQNQQPTIPPITLPIPTDTATFVPEVIAQLATQASQATATATLPPLDNVAVTAAVTPTAGPSPTAPSNPFDLGGTIALELRRNGYSNLWALAPGTPGLMRLTAGNWEDRNPAWSPDGRQLAFASNRAGSWDLYVLDMANGELHQVTNLPGYESYPSWSPDGVWLAFEGYFNSNLDVYIVQTSGAQLTRVTNHPAADFAPAWSPGGREIAFVSYRAGQGADLFVRSLDNPDDTSGTTRLTSTLAISEDAPRWSPDGKSLLYYDTYSPLNLIYTLNRANPAEEPQEVGNGNYPAWTPDGAGIVTAYNQGDRQFLAAAALGETSNTPVGITVTGQIRGIAWTTTMLPAQLTGTIATAATVAESPAWQEVLTASNGTGNPPYRVIELAGVIAPQPRLNDRVDESFRALRQRVAETAGWDYLSALENALIALGEPLPPSMPLESWNKAGRAIDLPQAAYSDGWLYVVRKDSGNRTYWDLWLKVIENSQGSTLGEPLRVAPWDFASRYSGDVTAYDNGGKYMLEPPSGSYINLSVLAADYGWQQVPATENWRLFYPGIQYWHLENRGGLKWTEAMAEIYSNEGQLGIGTGAGAGIPAQPVSSPVVLITPQLPSVPLVPSATPIPPSATPVPPSATPVPTQTPVPPSVTPLPTQTNTPAASATPTASPTATVSVTPTATVTLTPTVVIIRLGPSR